MHRTLKVAIKKKKKLRDTYKRTEEVTFFLSKKIRLKRTFYPLSLQKLQFWPPIKKMAIFVPFVQKLLRRRHVSHNRGHNRIFLRR